MRIGLLAADERLADELTHIVYRHRLEWSVCATVHDAEEAHRREPFAAMIVSDRLFDFAGLQEWLELASDIEPDIRAMVLLSNRHDTAANEAYVKLCKMKQIDYVLPGRGTAAIADQVRAWMDGPQSGEAAEAGRGKLIAFMGTTPNIGTTVASFGVAYSLAIDTSSRIGYICLNLKSSKLHRYLGKAAHVSSLDSLRAELKSRSLHQERLLQTCDTVKGAPRLHVLYGNMLREQAEFFSPAEIECLLGIARMTFDICIVEVSAYWDNAATVCGLLQADSKVLVTAPDAGQFREDLSRWIGQVGAVVGLQQRMFELVAVQTERGGSEGSFTLADIRKETQLHALGQISRSRDILWATNRGKLLDCLEEHAALRPETALIARKLAQFHMLPQSEEPPRKAWLRRLLAG